MAETIVYKVLAGRHTHAKKTYGEGETFESAYPLDHIKNKLERVEPPKAEDTETGEGDDTDTGTPDTGYKLERRGNRFLVLDEDNEAVHDGTLSKTEATELLESLQADEEADQNN